MALPTSKTIVSKDYSTRIMEFYGMPKTGKSTFCSQLGDDKNKRVLFFATEPGHKELSIYKYTNEDGSDPKNWDDFRLCVAQFAKADDYQMLAIDTTSNLVEWCSNYVLKKNQKSDESEGSYGDLYRKIRREFQNVINYLGQLNKGIIFIAHQKIDKNTFGSKEQSIIEPDLPDKYKNLFNGMVDYILYFHVNFQGQRLIRTKGTDSVVAGDRSGELPEIIPMDAKLFMRLANGETADIEKDRILKQTNAPSAEQRG